MVSVQGPARVGDGTILTDWRWRTVRTIVETEPNYAPVPSRRHGTGAFSMEGHQSVRMLRYMARRPPVDDERLREQLWQRLTAIDGVNIPADTLARRPRRPHRKATLWTRDL